MPIYDSSTAHPYEHLSVVRDIACDETHIPPTTASLITAIEAPSTSAPLWCPKMTESVHAQLLHLSRVGVMDAEDIALYSHCWHWLDADGQPTNTAEGERHCFACGTIAVCPWCCPPLDTARASTVLLMECPACKALMRERARLEERLRGVVLSLQRRGVVLSLQRRCALAMPPLVARPQISATSVTPVASSEKEAHP